MKNKKKILILSTYPLKNPIHGGQIRASQIAKAYIKLNYSVYNIAVYQEESWDKSDIGKLDVPFPVSSEYRSTKDLIPSNLADYLSGIYAFNDLKAYAKILKNVPEGIDIVEIEQPWLFNLAKRLIRTEKFSKNATLIFSSHNIEHKLEEGIYQSNRILDKEKELNEINALECEAAKGSDLCFAVTEEDKQWLEKSGAKEVILAPNGVSGWDAKEEYIRKWEKKLPTTPFLLYVASGHPPNFKSFIEIFGGSLACIPPDSKLVIAGSVCAHLQKELNNSQLTNLNISRVLFLGVLEDNHLAAVKSLCAAFIIPIKTGGGSNLKTAEAIYSGKPVICTSMSLRGFEHYLKLPEVFVADTPDLLWKHIHEILSRPPDFSVIQGVGIRKLLEWSNVLKNVLNRAMDLSKNSTRIEQ